MLMIGKLVIGKWLLVIDLGLLIAQFYIHNSRSLIVVYIIPNYVGMFNENKTFFQKKIPRVRTSCAPNKVLTFALT